MMDNATLGVRGKLSDADETASTAFSNTLLESVDVKVEAFLGERSMTFGDLKGLRPGNIIALNAALNEIVELRVNGVKIAYGELVAVGDNFGVRVISVAP